MRETNKGEALELLSRLEALCSGSGRSEKDRLSMYRLLHSLKSWAALRHLDEIEALCHRLEQAVRGDGPLTQAVVDLVSANTSAIHAGLHKKGPAPKRRLDPVGTDRVRILLPQKIMLDEKELGLIRGLRSQGREILISRIWISPDEAMPLTRILLLQSILEDHSVIRGEAWFWDDTGPIGPKDTRVWTAGSESGNGWRGALYRCIYARNSNSGDSLDRLWIDQVESIHTTVLHPVVELEANLIVDKTGAKEMPSRDEIAQNLMLQQRRFMPGPRGMSVNSYLSYENSWNSQTNLIHEIQGIDAGEYIKRIFRQASELPLAVSTNEGYCAPLWRLLVEPVLLPEAILRALGDVLVQLIRNSLAHGRQDEATRLSLHKPAAMIIRLALMVQGDSLILQYSDDGKGIDADRVLGKAGRSPGEPLSNADLLEIISTPEFSTNDQALTNAGRGMGLNLVDHTVRQILRGNLELQNRAKKGASFTINIPRRLFPVSVNVYEGMDGFFAIPGVYAASSMPLDAASVDYVQDSQWFFRFAGRCIRFLKTEGISSPAGLSGMMGILLIRDGLVFGVVPVHRFLGAETILMEVASDSVFVRMMQSWIGLYTGET